MDEMGDLYDYQDMYIDESDRVTKDLLYFFGKI